MTIITLHKTDPEKLDCVLDVMGERGTPTVRVVEVGDGEYVAIEGTHRIAAAKILGHTPELIEIAYSDELLPEDIQNETGEYTMTISELVDATQYHAAYDQTEIIDF